MTAATAGLPANVNAYLAQLRAELADLAPDERDDLLAEVEASLLESAGEEPLDAQFGPPAAFAADLRVSAGLPPRRAAKAPCERRGRLGAGAREAARARADLVGACAATSSSPRSRWPPTNAWFPRSGRCRSSAAARARRRRRSLAGDPASDRARPLVARVPREPRDRREPRARRRDRPGRADTSRHARNAAATS